MDWFTEEGRLKWMLIDAELKNFKASMEVFIKSKNKAAEIHRTSAKFALDMMGSIGNESPDIYKALWSLYPDEVKEMLKLCANSQKR